jgi:hypothetical protein
MAEMSKERLYLFDTTLRARSRAGARPRALDIVPERRARTHRVNLPSRGGKRAAHD